MHAVSSWRYETYLPWVRIAIISYVNRYGRQKTRFRRPLLWWTGVLRCVTGLRPKSMPITVRFPPAYRPTPDSRPMPKSILGYLPGEARREPGTGQLENRRGRCIQKARHHRHSGKHTGLSSASKSTHALHRERTSLRWNGLFGADTGARRRVFLRGQSVGLGFV